MSPGPILVALAPGQSGQTALDKARILARSFGANIELFSCLFDEAMEGSHFIETDHLRAARETRVNAALADLEARATPLRDAGLDVTTHAVYEHPRHESLARRAKETGADLLVLGTHEHSWVERCLLGATEWQLIRGCPCPLLLVRDVPWSAPLRVLAAVDPGHRDDEHAVLDGLILSAAVRLAPLPAEIHVAHCIVSAEDILAAAAAGSVPPFADILPEEITRTVAAERRQRIEALAARANLEDLHLHLLEGRATDQLPDLAARIGADLLVLGGVSRSRLAQVFVGGTAERLLDRTPCDLLVMRPPGASADPAGA